MSTLLQARDPSGGTVSLLRLLDPPSDAVGVFWRINGFRATLLVWTDEEWKRLDTRPLDAQFHPSGVWCALRID